MFGHNDDSSSDQKDDKQGSVNSMPPVVPDPSITAGLHDGSADPAPSTSTPSAPSVPSAPSIVEPATKTDSTDSTSGVLPVDNGGDPGSIDNSAAKDSDNAASNADSASSPADSELMELKQQALQKLSPLVGHLDQTPEEKFRTTMMMIQASDDSSLVKTAFEAAQAIEDEKARAQALLDVINEINYFTQHKSEESSLSVESN